MNIDPLTGKGKYKIYKSIQTCLSLIHWKPKIYMKLSFILSTPEEFS